MRLFEFTDKPITSDQLKQIETYADRLFKAAGLDIEFSRHFLDRVNDRRNKKQITLNELRMLFKKVYKQLNHGKQISNLGPDAQAVLKDMMSDINMPFVLKLDGDEIDLVAKTIMRKKDFKTSNPILTVR